MDDNETLPDVAPEGQPTDEAVAPDLSAEPSFENAAAAPDNGQPAPRLYAGKYKSPEELEQSYLDSQREASRMAGELAAYRKTAQPQAQTADPIAATIEKHEAERGKWERYDREISKLEAKREYTQDFTRSTATQSLEADALAVFETYQQDLSPGSPLYTMAEQRYAQMVRAGYPEGTASKADAVLWAAHKTGASKTRVVQTDRKELLGNLQKQARAAQKAGAGTATVAKSGAMTAKQFEAMGDAEFAKWERENVLGV
jgi:hypothetical protein